MATCEARGINPFFALTKVGGFGGKFGSGTTAGTVVQHLAQNYGHITDRVVSDQRESMSLGAIFQRYGFQFRSIAWTNPNKIEAISWMLRLFREKTIGLQPHAGLRTELLNFREKLQPSGATTYEGRKSDDYVALLITAGLADMAGWLGGSPNHTGRGRTDFGPGDSQ